MKQYWLQVLSQLILLAYLFFELRVLKFSICVKDSIKLTDFDREIKPALAFIYKMITGMKEIMHVIISIFLGWFCTIQQVNVSHAAVHDV